MILHSVHDDQTVEEVHHRLRRSLGGPVVVGERVVDHDRSRAFSLASRCAAGAYYAHRANVAATARALHVHVNTLLKRLPLQPLPLSRKVRQ